MAATASRTLRWVLLIVALMAGLLQAAAPEAIRSNPNYGGGPINLVTCHGACGAAQELQEIMGVPVNASPFRVDLDPWSGFLREFR
jgi:hypothetical protein